MKIAIASAVALTLGLVLGWHYERHRAEREKTEIVQQMVEGLKSSDGEHAARAVRAIEFIESGEPQQAVRLLSGPIASYYTIYGVDGATERQSKLRSLIEELARTNQVVAARIAELTTDSQVKKP